MWMAFQLYYLMFRQVFTSDSKFLQILAGDISDQLLSLVSCVSTALFKYTRAKHGVVKNRYPDSVIVNCTFFFQYQRQGSNPQWKAKGEAEQLLDLLLAYNYTSTGQRFLEDSWLNVNESDPMLYAVKTRMIDFMTELESGDVNVNSTIHLVSVLCYIYIVLYQLTT